MIGELPFISVAGEYLAGILRGEDLQSFKKNLANEPKVKMAVNELEILIESFLGAIANEALSSARDESLPSDVNQETWPSIAPGVTGRVLHYDHMVGSMVYIAKLEPDANCPAADDGSPEECMLNSKVA